MFERAQLQVLKKRIEEPRKFIQVLYGPRQVGKTTLINQLLPKLAVPYSYFSADAILGGSVAWLSQIWETARQMFHLKGAKEYLLIIDEIQKVPYWSETVKQEWDKDTFNGLNIKLVILGSSSLLIQKGLTESLAGRFETVYLGHWSFMEMNEAFDWTAEQYAWFGSYPGAVDLVADESRWKQYIRDALIETSISKDVLMMSRVDKPVLLRRLFELGCFYSGQILSFNKILEQLTDAGNTTTLSHYLNLLGVASLLSGIEKYAAGCIRKRSASPKFQVHNNALLSAQSDLSFNEFMLNPKEKDRIIESAVGCHILNASFINEVNMLYWREGNDEVDFVLEKKGKVIGLEVKSNDASLNHGMDTFVNKYKPYKTILVGNRGIPWPEFLKINPVELF